MKISKNRNFRKNRKIEKFKIFVDFFRKIGNFLIFRFSRKFRFFEIFIENPMKILIFRENSGAKNLQLQNHLTPKLRGRKERVFFPDMI